MLFTFRELGIPSLGLKHCIGKFSLGKKKRVQWYAITLVRGTALKQRELWFWGLSFSRLMSLWGMTGYVSEQAVVLGLVFQKIYLLKASCYLDWHQIVFSLTSQRQDILGDLRELQIHIIIITYIFSEYLMSNY